MNDHQMDERNIVGRMPPPKMNKTALEILLKMFRQEMGNMQQQANNQQQPIMAMPPSLGQCPPVQERCDEKPLWNALMGYGFLIVFCFALIGNCLNLLIYNSDHIRFFIAIRMLCTKLLMNTLMMVVMLPQALRVIRLWDIGGPTDQLYWRFWPYQAYLTNVFGFCAMWLTVMMTAECYVHIFFPSKSKVLCTKGAVWRVYLLILFTALILASIYPLNRNVSLVTKCERIIVKIHTSQHQLMVFFEKVHAIADLLLSIIVPLSLLVFMTAMIVWRLWVWPNRHSQRCHRQQRDQTPSSPASSNLLSATNSMATAERKTIRGKHFAAEKRGVTRITLITCLVQLITETPSMSVLIYAAMFGPNVHKGAHNICTWQTISYFLCLCNASLSFFVYITFSTRFRSTMISSAQLLLHRFCPSLFKGAASALSQRGSRHQLAITSSCTSHLVLMSSKNESPQLK